MIVTRLLASTALVTASLGAQSSSAVTRTLTKADAEFAEPFSQVSGVRELRDGRIIVADLRDKTLQLIDLQRGVARKIAREGSGPSEYGIPASLLPLTGDTTLVNDPPNSRYLVILPDGRAGTTFRLDVTLSTTPNGTTRDASPTQFAGGPPVLRNPRASDDKGRIYFEGSPFAMGPRGPVVADSVPILRYTRALKWADTIAWLRLPKNAASIKETGSAQSRNVIMRVGSNTPFEARDSWTVLPDGRLVIAHVAPYHVEVITPGRARVTGPVIAYAPVRVGDAEKEEFRQASKSASGVMTRVTNDNGKVESQTGTGAPKFEEPAAWPAVKPPFASNQVYARPNGEIWVMRNRRAGDAVPVFDVFDASGRLSGRTALPRGHRLVGFGNGTVYTVRLDEDDQQHLQRFRLP